MSAADVAGNSLTTNEVWSVTTLPVPTDVSLSADSSSVQVSWQSDATFDANGGNAEVWMQTGGSGDWTKVAQTDAGVASGPVTVTGLTPGTQYAFKVRLVTPGQTSLFSEAQTITPEVAAASDLVATAAADSTAIHLGWTASTDAVYGYRIYRSTDGGAAFSYLASTSETAYDDTTMAEGSTAIYYVTAFRTTGSESLPSNDASATTLLSPGDLAATTASANKIDLSWTASSSTGVDHYVIYASVDGVQFDAIDSVPADQTGYAADFLTPGQRSPSK